MGAAVKRKPRAAAKGRRHVIGSKGGAKKQKQPSIASNSVPSISTARMVYLWSWGPIVGPVDGLRSIKLDGTPIMAEDGTLNYPGVKWQFRSGELNQERLEGVTEASNEIDVGQELKSTVPWVHTVTRDVADAVRLRFGWPQLQSQDRNGNINGVRIDYAVDVATDGGPYQELLTSFVDRKNITKYERSHRIELPAGSRWTVRARRITPEANNSLVSDGMLVEAIAEVVDSDQEYPLTAVGCLEYDAQQFGGDIAKVAALMRGRIVRVPMNYDPATRTYSTAGTGTSNGVWDGTFKEVYTNNPAWIFYDLALNPYYGLGERIDASMINRWALYRIAQYCDQMVPDGKGGQEPRFTCNLYLQKQAEGWAVLQDLAAIFHGLAFWDGSQIVVNADMPQDSAYTYTMSQILGDGAVKYNGSKWRDRHSLAMVSFDDPGQGFDTDKEPVFDEEAMAEYGVRETSVEAVGCTSRGQAQRAGQWTLQTEQLQLRGGSIRVGLDGYIPKPGKVISLADPMLAGRANGGRIAAAAGRVVTVDRDIEVPTGARLLVNLPSGKSEARQVRSVAGRQITVMADYSEAPEAECAWALDYDDLKLMQFYVRNVTRPEWHQFQLELIQHEPTKFDAIDYGTVIDDRPISVLPAGVQDAPARVLITSHSAVDQGIAVTTMTIGWDQAPNAVAYDVEWRWGSRDWIKLPRTGELSADVRGVYAGQYLARVRAVNAMDVSSMPTTSMLTDLAGKTTPPPAVSFLRTTPIVYGTGLAWGFPAGAEDTQRTEIWQSATTSRDDAVKLGDFAYPQADHEIHGLAAGVSFFYWARLIDRSGNIGPWYPDGVGVNGQSSSEQSAYEEYFKEKITSGSLYPALRAEIELVSAPPSVPGSVNGRLQDLSDQVTEVTDEIERKALQAQQDLQEQIDQISDLSDSMPYVPGDTYAVGQAVLGEDGKLYQASKDVPAQTPPPNAAYWTDIGQAVQTANGTAARVTAVETKVTEQEGKLTAQASRIDGVQSSLTTTNQNVTAAQTAANAAATLAGGKGKVMVQSGAPAVADRLAQNLWIDTTGNANTPKRWSGSAWVAVSDKVATDAAAAAANALSVANTKADAAVVDSITTRVTDAEGKITSQGQAITGVQNSLTTTNQNVTAAQGAAQAAADLAGSKGKVLVQSAAPAVADRLAQNLWIDTTGNANTPKRWSGSAWVAVSDKVATDAAAAAASALTQVATKADASTVSNLSNTVTQQGQEITAQGQAITDVKASISNVSGENLLLDPTFSSGNGIPNLATAPVLARNDAGVPAGAPSARVVKIARETSTSNHYSWLASGVNVRPPEGGDREARVAVAAGDAYDFEAWVYSTVSRQIGIWPQVFDATGEQAGSTWVPAGGDGVRVTTTAGAWTKLSGQLTIPAGIIQMQMTLRITAGDATDVFLSSPSVRKRTGQENSQASATQSLDARVAQNEGTLSSQGQAITAINTSLGKKADSSALQSLQSEVTQQGQTINSQGAAITAVKATVDGIGGSGVNLVPAEYSVFGPVKPEIVYGTTVAAVVEDAAAMNGWALKTTSNSTNTSATIYTTALDAYASYNMAAKPGKYILSYRAKTDTPGHVVALFLRARDSAGAASSSSGAAQVALTDTWTRYSEVVDLTAATYAAKDKMTIGIQMNRSGVSGRVAYFDQIMLEPMIGGNAAPSPFAVGDSFRQSVANAAATQAIDVRVKQAEGTLTTQGSAVTQLQTGLTTTNQNVTTAQTAAEAAATLAGGKGKVIVQNGAPAVADRLAQNLWIDTTGGANTPKRWSGSAWAAVTDKVATDAAAAAASALTQVGAKADASAVQSLQTEVTQQGKTLTSTGTAVTQLQNSVGGIAGAGSNLLSDEYSWVTSLNPPLPAVGSTTRQGWEVPASDSGFGYLVRNNTGNASAWVMFCATNNAAGYNVRIEPGTYLVSMYVSSNVSGAAGRVSLYDGNHRYSAEQPVPQGRTRITFPVTVNDSAKVGITFYFNRAAIADIYVTIDSVMIEKRIGENNTPSPFVAGSSARAVTGQAGAITQLDTQVKQVGTQVTAAATRLDLLTAQVSPEMEGDSSGQAGATGASVGVWTEQSARVEDGIATGRRVDGVMSEVSDVRAAIQIVNETMASDRKSTATSIQDVQTSFGTDLSAATQIINRTVATLDGKVDAQVTIKAQTLSNGRKVMAGLALGANGETSEILAYAQRFAIMDEASGVEIAPFVVQNGQVFISQALIGSGWITNAMIGSGIQSNNYVTGVSGWRLNFSGYYENNGTGGTGRRISTNTSERFYDAAGVLRIRIEV